MAVRDSSRLLSTLVLAKIPSPTILVDGNDCSPQLLRVHPQLIDQPTKSRPLRPSNRAIAPVMQWFLPN